MRTPKTPIGFDLFEVYEESGELLFVASYLPDPGDLNPTDKVYRRTWATAAVAKERTSPGVWTEVPR